MTNEIVPQEKSYGVVNFEDYAMSTARLVQQVNLIQDVMAKVMKKDEHYGIIPGTKKPSLYKPGAEKLCMVFRLEPDYEIIREFRQEEFIAYTVKCTLQHIPTGQVIASGVGSCNSREEKYRWRYDETPTDKQVPKEYWKARDAGDTKEMKRLIGDGMRTVKVDGVWMIATATKVENDNPWDLDNTIMKMACKRALVAATLNATAASDIFTQDVEDMPESLLQGQQKGGDTTTEKKEHKQPQSKSGQQTEAPPDAEGDLTVKEKLDKELREYCADAEGLVDMNLYKSVLKEVSTWTDKEKKEHSFDEITEKISDKWAGSALGKLRDKTKVKDA